MLRIIDYKFEGCDGESSTKTLKEGKKKSEENSNLKFRYFWESRLRERIKGERWGEILHAASPLLREREITREKEERQSACMGSTAAWVLHERAGRKEKGEKVIYNHLLISFGLKANVTLI